MAVVKMPSSSDIDRAYKEGAGRAPSRYKDAVSKTTGVIAAGVAGQKLYEQRMSDPKVLKRREEKLSKVTDSEWQKKATGLGAERIGRGMLENADKRAKNYEPIRSGLDGLSIPDRVADTDANIDARLKAVVHKMQEAAGKR